MNILPYLVKWTSSFLIGERTFSIVCPNAKKALLHASILEKGIRIRRVEVWHDDERIFLSVK